MRTFGRRLEPSRRPARSQAPPRRPSRLPCQQAGSSCAALLGRPLPHRRQSRRRAPPRQDGGHRSTAAAAAGPRPHRPGSRQRAVEGTPPRRRLAASSTNSRTASGSSFPAREQVRLSTSSWMRWWATGRWSRCCDDDSINDIMVNGPNQVFVEVARQGCSRPNVRFRDGSSSPLSRRRWPPRSAGASTNRARWWTAACRTAAASTSCSRRWRIDGACISIRKFSKKRFDSAGHGRQWQHDAAIAPRAGDRGALPAEHRDLRRHRLGQDHAAERA